MSFFEMICAITWSGFESLLSQKSFQIASILLQGSSGQRRPSRFAAN
jgi:hypothetical protein